MSEMPHRSTKESVLWSCIQPLLKKRCPHEGKRRPKSTAIVRSENSGSRLSPRATQASRQKLQRRCLQQDNDAKTPPSPAMSRVIARFSPAAPSPHCMPGLDARIHNHLADHLRRRRWSPPPRQGPEPPTSSAPILFLKASVWILRPHLCHERSESLCSSVWAMMALWCRVPS